MATNYTNASIEPKDVFSSPYRDVAEQMLNYIKYDLGVQTAEIWNFIGYYIISVPVNEYESVLTDGKKYACEEDLGISWIDYYDGMRYPVAAYDVGLALLPDKLIPGEQNFFDRYSWGYSRNRTPESINNYIDDMKKYLGVDRVLLRYHSDINGIRLSPIITDQRDYETLSEEFEEFVKEYGYGPFKRISPLTITGEYINIPMKVKKDGNHL